MINARKRPIGEILKQRRKELKISAADVCDILKNVDNIEISVSTLYGYENGHRKLPPETLLALCDIYDLDNLLVSFGYASPQEEDADCKENFLQSEIEERVINALNKLNKFGQEEAVKRVEELTEIQRYLHTAHDGK